MRVLDFAVVVLLAAPALADETVVHEWGTFTSVAGADGNSEVWQALDGPAELPCFVHRLANPGLKWDPSMVRMETPVLYFYSPQKTRVAVHVSFQQGQFTEWYPMARISSSGATRLDWDEVAIDSGATVDFPATKATSRYFAARETDATPIRVGAEQEKMIFYRGIGNFRTPLAARIPSGTKLELWNHGKETIAAAIVFDRHEGRARYRTISQMSDSATLDLADLAGDAAGLQHELQALLEGQGLYPREAAAMIETWKDSWFEEGTRVIWLAPSAMTESVLPLSVTPQPFQTVRVFVGRTEVLSPATRTELSAALAEGNLPVLEKYGRFIEPFLRQISPLGIRATMSGKSREFLDKRQMDIRQNYNQAACIR
jgi:hypothetical protein